MHVRLPPPIAPQGKRSSEHLENMQRLFPGVHGRVIELCKPSQKKYNAAVTIAMGKNMDAIVVDNEAAAQDCIRYLKEKKVRVHGHTTVTHTTVTPHPTPNTHTQNAPERPHAFTSPHPPTPHTHRQRAPQEPTRTSPSPAPPASTPTFVLTLALALTLTRARPRYSC